MYSFLCIYLAKMFYYLLSLPLLSPRIILLPHSFSSLLTLQLQIHYTFLPSPLSLIFSSECSVFSLSIFQSEYSTYLPVYLFIYFLAVANLLVNGSVEFLVLVFVFFSSRIPI